MPEIPPVFEQRLDFDPEGDFEAFLRLAPAKWVVYLLSDAEDRPVQLLCVKNLRYSLKRRLGTEGEATGLSKRVNYRELVRHVRWRRVDSAFEADWLYYEAARAVFPESYRGMVGFRPAWFMHVNPEAKFPRYVKTIDLLPRPGVLIGPVEDKHAAGRLIEIVEDTFDLCRYYHILTEAPHGGACAYKEMGKCPAPCDGSISLEQYRRLVEWSSRTLVDPAEFLREQTKRMEAAAGELRFETAAKVKAYIGQVSQFGKGPYRHAARLEDFAYLSLQHGPRPQGGSAKVFLITPGRIEEILGVISEPKPSEVLRIALTRVEERAGAVIDEAGAERIGIVAHHLFSPKQSQGVFLRMEDINEKAIAKAWRDLKKQAVPAEELEGEGVMKELQAL
ncbi:MAG: excinuclease subunit-like protein [Phycisphaerales bacterium]|jgi:excinuclease UvrABC nuclease subunit|nr:excinuclease subunit-like protein [Phycisphaerales bacterium]